MWRGRESDNTMSEGKTQRFEVVLDEMIPNEGDAMTIVNKGRGHYEVIALTSRVPSLDLTDDDIDRLKRGEVTFQ